MEIAALKGRFISRSAAMPQSLSKIYIHAVYSTKNREPVLLDSWRDELFQVIGGIANNIGCQSLLVGGVADHRRRRRRTAETNSSLWVNQTRGLSEPFHWQAGYAAFSIGRAQVEDAQNYIRRQPEHHHTQSFQDELRAWLRRYEIEWDERYVWD